jgi:lactate dehydrogenase-like 2-hydroxyacid dehydrogenase
VICILDDKVDKNVIDSIGSDLKAVCPHLSPILFTLFTSPCPSTSPLSSPLLPFTSINSYL